MTEMSDISTTAGRIFEISTREEPARPEPLNGQQIPPFRPRFRPENAELAKNWPKNDQNGRYLENGLPDPRKKGRKRDRPAPRRLGLVVLSL
jgi:hypothetical protein